jgi:predicted acetyltransferase
MPSRSDAWWRSWRLAGPPGTFGSGPPMFRALLELDGEPAGYALYRIHSAWETGTSVARLDVLEAIATSSRATAALWRFLLELGLVERVRALHLPRDHPLFMLARQPARLRMTLTDGLWIRIIDLAEALSRRSYAMDAELVLEVDDPSMSWNHGRWLVTASTTGGQVARTERPADLALTAEDLGSLYLGGVTVAALLDAGRADELRPGAAEAFDGAFRTGLDPWCPDEF